MIEKIKTAPIPVKIAMAIIGLFALVAVYTSPLFTIGIIAFVWAIHTLINYFVEDQFK